jgi:TRAP-type uncharacterized transport system substrate-binding protein
MPSSLHSLFSFARTAFAAATLCCLAVNVHAEDTKVGGALRIATGPASKVYERMVGDMQAVCGTAVPMRSVTSTGGLQNLSLLSSNDADLGIVQIDTLRDMKGGDENIQALQAVMPLHNNLLHILTLAQGSLVGAMKDPIFGKTIPGTGNTTLVRKFSELKGLTVAVVGSAQLMGQKLEGQLGYGMQFVIAENDDHALAFLRAGKVQAVFTLGGWPLPSVARHTVGSSLFLVDFDLSPQPPYVTVKRNYQMLDAFNRTFLAVPNLLVTRPFKTTGTMGRQVTALKSCLCQHLDELQEGRYQAAWKEIKDPDNTFGVTPMQSAACVAAKGAKL